MPGLRGCVARVPALRPALARVPALCPGHHPTADAHGALPSSSSFTVRASFSASSFSFFSSSLECFSSALAPAPMFQQQLRARSGQAALLDAEGPKSQAQASLWPPLLPFWSWDWQSNGSLQTCAGPPGGGAA